LFFPHPAKRNQINYSNDQFSRIIQVKIAACKIDSESRPFLRFFYEKINLIFDQKFDY